MAEKQWAFLRNLSTTKFFSAAKAGVMTGQPPYSFGAIFCAALPLGTLRPIFGDAVAGPTSGFDITMSGPSVIVNEGTVSRFSGPSLNDGSVVASADGITYGVNDADLINHSKSYFQPGSAFDGGGATTGAFAWPSPRFGQLVHVAVTVGAAGNLTVYCNGTIVGQVAAASVPNANPVRIGTNAVAAQGAGPIWIGGCWYTNFEYSDGQIYAHYRACQQAKDLVNFGSFDSLGILPIQYLWSVKRSRLADGRTSWLSAGAAATPIAMNLTGALAIGGADSDILAADMSWMTV